MDKTCLSGIHLSNDLDPRRDHVKPGSPHGLAVPIYKYPQNPEPATWGPERPATLSASGPDTEMSVSSVTEWKQMRDE